MKKQDILLSYRLGIHKKKYMKKKPLIFKKCPNCGKKTLVESIFGNACTDNKCSYNSI